MSDLSELTRVRPDPDDLPELDLPGLHRRARRRDRLRVAATTTLAIAVLGAGVVGIDRLIAPFGVPGVEIGPMGPGQTDDGTDPPGDGGDRMQGDEPTHPDQRIALLERTARMLAEHLQQTTDSLADLRQRESADDSEREVAMAVIERSLAGQLERTRRELVEVERSLVAERARAANLASGAPHDVLVDTAWFGPSGEPVSAQRLNVIRGPDHCDFQDLLFLRLGWPLESTEEPDSFRQYIRDPDGMLDERVGQPLAIDAALPAEVAPTSHHTLVASLWLGPNDGQDAIYLVFADHVERWPRAAPPVLCM